MQLTAFAFKEDARVVYDDTWTKVDGLDAAYSKLYDAFVYNYGALVLVDRDESPDDIYGSRLTERLEALREVFGLWTLIGTETLALVERRGKPGWDKGPGRTMHLPKINLARLGGIARVLSQSVAMEYYEVLAAESKRAVAALLETRLPKLRLMPTLKKAMLTRAEVMSVLHMLDIPDGAWYDGVAYEVMLQLRDEYDLGNRFDIIREKLQFVQDSIEVLARARTDWLVIVLIAIEIIMLPFI